MRDLVVDYHDPVRPPAGHTEFLAVDDVEECRLVEIECALQVACDLGPADVEDAQAHGRVVDALGQPGDPAPQRLELLQRRMMEDRVELHAELAIDLRDQRRGAEAQALDVQRIGVQRIGRAGVGWRSRQWLRRRNRRLIECGGKHVLVGRRRFSKFDGDGLADSRRLSLRRRRSRWRRRVLPVVGQCRRRRHGLASGDRQDAVGMRATSRIEVVSSSNCSQGRRCATAL